MAKSEPDINPCDGAGSFGCHVCRLDIHELIFLRYCFCFTGWFLRRVHQPNVAVVNPDILFGSARVFLRFFTYHDLLNEQPQDFRRELRDVAVPFGFVNKTVPHWSVSSEVVPAVAPASGASPVVAPVP